MPTKSAAKPAKKKAPAKKSVARATKPGAAKAAKSSRKAAGTPARKGGPKGVGAKSTSAGTKSASANRFSKKPSGGSGSRRAAGGTPVAPPRGSSPYSVHPGVLMMVKWAGELKSKTGRTLDEWVDLLKHQAPAKFQDRVAFLKSKHAMGTNAAWWIAERADGKGAEDLDPELYLKAAAQYVEEQFAGKKAALRPLYEKLLALCLSMDKRAKACPCKTMVPIYLDHVVAQLRASTNTRIDLGLALGDTKASGRLIDTGGFAKKDRITHRIEIASEKDIDGFVKEWLAAAYARSSS